MDAATLAKIVDPSFYKDPGKGTGWPVDCPRNRQQNGGRVGCTASRVGTTFKLYFPSSVRVVVKEPCRKTVPQELGGPYLVEDDPRRAK